MGKYNCICLNEFLNNKGITKIEDAKQGDLSIGMSSLPRDVIMSSNPLLYNGIPFVFRIDNGFDNIAAENQKIPIDATARKIFILGTSCQGDYCEEFGILKSDGVIEKYFLGLTDFWSAQAYFDDDLALRTDYCHSQTGIAHDMKMSLWVNSINLKKNEKIKYLILPDNIFFHIFAITLE